MVKRNYIFGIFILCLVFLPGVNAQVSGHGNGNQDCPVSLPTLSAGLNSLVVPTEACFIYPNQVSSDINTFSATVTVTGPSTTTPTLTMTWTAVSGCTLNGAATQRSATATAVQLDSAQRFTMTSTACEFTALTVYSSTAGTHINKLFVGNVVSVNAYQRSENHLCSSVLSQCNGAVLNITNAYQGTLNTKIISGNQTICLKTEMSLCGVDTPEMNGKLIAGNLTVCLKTEQTACGIDVPDIDMHQDQACGDTTHCQVDTHNAQECGNTIACQAELGVGFNANFTVNNMTFNNKLENKITFGQYELILVGIAFFAVIAELRNDALYWFISLILSIYLLINRPSDSAIPIQVFVGWIFVVLYQSISLLMNKKAARLDGEQ